MQLNVPNLLSLSRLVLAIVFVFARQPMHQAVIIGLAGLTDMTDGWIARRFGQRSRTGEVLDPVTDKLFVLAVVLTLLLRQQLQLWQVLVLLTRDFFNTGAYIYLKLRASKLRFTSRQSGKLVTVLQIATLMVAIVLPRYLNAALWITFAASLVSIVDYTRAGLARLRETP